MIEAPGVGLGQWLCVAGHSIDAIVQSGHASQTADKKHRSAVVIVLPVRLCGQYATPKGRGDWELVPKQAIPVSEAPGRPKAPVCSNLFENKEQVDGGPIRNYAQL